MILKLPYKPFRRLPYMTERPVEIILRVGTLEDVCDELMIDFWQIKDFMNKNDFDFSHLLLYHGYLTACQKRYEKPIYTKQQAAIWYEFMSTTEKKKFIQEIGSLFGKLVKSYKPVKKKAQST
jgi:hypothetical protein